LILGEIHEKEIVLNILMKRVQNQSISLLLYFIPFEIESRLVEVPSQKLNVNNHTYN
jgi:hypothetical protein